MSNFREREAGAEEDCLHLRVLQITQPKERLPDFGDSLLCSFQAVGSRAQRRPQKGETVGCYWDVRKGRMEDREVGRSCYEGLGAVQGKTTTEPFGLNDG